VAREYFRDEFPHIAAAVSVGEADVFVFVHVYSLVGANSFAIFFEISKIRE
jgi:hypothetical protein